MSVFSVRGVVAFMPKIAAIQCYYYTSRASSVTAVFVTHVAASSVTMALVAAHTVARSAHYDSIVVIDSLSVSMSRTCKLASIRMGLLLLVICANVSRIPRNITFEAVEKIVRI